MNFKVNLTLVSIKAHVINMCIPRQISHSLISQSIHTLFILEANYEGLCTDLLPICKHKDVLAVVTLSCFGDVQGLPGFFSKYFGRDGMPNFPFVFIFWIQSAGDNTNVGLPRGMFRWSGFPKGTICIPLGVHRISLGFSDRLDMACMLCVVKCLRMLCVCYWHSRLVCLSCNIMKRSLKAWKYQPIEYDMILL